MTISSPTTTCACKVYSFKSCGCKYVSTPCKPCAETVPRGLALPPVSSTRLASAKSTKFAPECPSCGSLTPKLKLEMAKKGYEDILNRFGPNDLMVKTAYDNYQSFKGNIERQLNRIRNSPNVDGWTRLR